MSRTFIESFFPSLLQLHTEQTRYIYDIILPNDVAQQCSEIMVLVAVNGHGDTFALRNPALLLFSVAGTMFGLYVGLFDTVLGILTIPLRKKLHPSLKAEWQCEQYRWWSASFLFFGLMNAAAVPLHSLLPVVDLKGQQKREPIPQQYPILWIMDTYFTGLFSLTLLVAIRGRHSHKRRNSASHGGETWRFILWILLIGWVAIARFVLYGTSIELELWYVVPILTTALYFSGNLLLGTRSFIYFSQPPACSSIYIAVFCILVGGLLLDAPLCRWSVQYRSQHSLDRYLQLLWWWDFGRLPAIAFGACDLAFFGIYLHVRKAISTNNKLHRS
jgi:hypothetical protein